MSHIQNHININNLSHSYKAVLFMTRGEGFRGKEHSHPYYQINYVESGVMFAGHSGKRFQLGKGHLYIVPPHQLHDQQTDSGYSQLKININHESNCELHYLLTTYIQDFKVLKLPSLLDDLSILKQDANHLSKLSKMKISNLLDRFVLLCIEETFHKDENNLAHQILQYIHKNINRKPSLQQICTQLAISKTQLEHFTSKQFGCGVIELSNRIRLDKACFLLATHPEMSVDQIAAQLAFYDHAHFSRFFKQRMSISPTQYRKSL